MGSEKHGKEAEVSYKAYLTVAPVLRQIIFGGKADFRAIQANEAEFVRCFRKCFLDAFALRYFGKYLGEKSVGILKPMAMNNFSRMLRMESELKRIQGALQKAGIDFVAFKGTDIAFRCFPSPAMRYMVDMDLLFHKEDLPDVVEILISLGWRKTLETDNGYHLSEFYKDDLHIEPHFELPMFPRDVQEELWLHTRMDEKRGLKIFTPEVVFLITLMHLQRSKWGKLNLVRFILDTAYLIKNDPPDWKKLAALEERWHLPDARILPKAFPEVIPDDLVPNNPPIDRELQKTFSYLVRKSYLFPAKTYEATMSGRAVFSPKWWKKSLLVFKPEMMRHKYGLPENGSKARLVACYTADVTSKCAKLTNYIIKRSVLPKDRKARYLGKIARYERISVKSVSGKKTLW